MKDKKYKIGIVGAGSVGLACAAFLSIHAEVVVKTRRKEQAEEIKIKGIIISEKPKNSDESISKKESLFKNIDATDNPKDLADCDGIIVTVKSYDTKKVAEELSDVVRQDTQILSLQNGLQAFEVLKETVKNPDRVFAGVTYIGATRLNDHGVSIGYNLRTIVDSKATVLTEALSPTRFEFESSTEIRQAVWNKMVQNTGINALCAIADLTLGELGASEKCISISQKLLDEFEKVAKAEGIYFNYSLIESLKENCKMAKHYPSMWQDIKNKKRTEIDAINGAISKLGKKHNIETPYNDMITSLIKIIEQKN